MRTAAVLPVKRFERAKQRLGASIPDPLRLDLTRAMVGDVLVALRETAAVGRTIVVTDEAPVAAAARYQGAIVVPDARAGSQNAAVALGLERALAEGFERALCVPGDCPTLDPAELELLLHSAPGEEAAVHGAPDADRGVLADGCGEVVIVPDRHGTGTNGLLLAPPDALSPGFGPGSFERHRESARAAGLAFRVERPPSLLLDVDTGEDLEKLRERLAGEMAKAPRTRAVLGLVVASQPILTTR
jgi:2-phospho-L-lactate guanylyltransferase